MLYFEVFEPYDQLSSFEVTALWPPGFVCRSWIIWKVRVLYVATLMQRLDKQNKIALIMVFRYVQTRKCNQDFAKRELEVKKLVRSF